METPEEDGGEILSILVGGLRARGCVEPVGPLDVGFMSDVGHVGVGVDRPAPAQTHTLSLSPKQSLHCVNSLGFCFFI